MHRQDIDTNPANYEPNSINDNWPRETPPAAEGGGFESYQERVEGHKVRERSPSFGEYYSQPRLFWLSQTPVEQQHIIGAYSFELSKVARPYIRERVVDHLLNIDIALAQGVAENLGIALTADQLNTPPAPDVNGLKKDDSLSLYAVPGGEIKGRQVALLLSDGVKSADVLAVLQSLQSAGVHAKLLAAHMGQVVADDGSVLPVDATFSGLPSLTFDAVFVPDGNIDAILLSGDSRYFLLEAYKHLKVIGLSGEARRCKTQFALQDDEEEEGVIDGQNADSAMMSAFIDAMKAHRVWSRSQKALSVPA